MAGPSEMAYFAQVSAVAAALDAQAPLPVPRWSGTVIEPHVQRLLDRYGLSLEGLADPHAAEGLVAREGLPATVREALGRLRGSTAAPIEALVY